MLLNVKAGFLISIALLLLISCQSVYAASLFDQGRENYKHRRYWAASDNFRAHLAKHPQHQLGYLHFGVCLEVLKDREGAEDAYSACYAINPFTREGRLAQQYLLKLAERRTPKRAQDKPHHVAQTANLMNQQSRELQQRAIREANSRANASRRTTGFDPRMDMWQSRLMDYSARFRIRPTIGGFSSAHTAATPQVSVQTYHSGFSRFDDEFSDIDLVRQGRMQILREANAIRMQAHGQKRAADSQAFCNNLVTRLGQESKSGNPLRAIGSNLYVQYYGSNYVDDDTPPPPDPPLELSAPPAKLGDWCSVIQDYIEQTIEGN